MKHRLEGIRSMIGNTPLLAIDFEYKGKARRLYAKAEHLNLTGSIKDRMGFYILEKAIEDGHLKPNMPIYEATSGNTGIAIAAIGRALGHQVCIFMPDWMSEERKNLIRSLGAEIVLVSKEEGGFLGSIERANRAAEENNGFLPSQFSNDNNSTAHQRTTGPEIWWQMAAENLRVDAIVAGVGTGGTIMGCSRFFKSMNPDIRCYPLEPENSPTLSTGHKAGSHRIQGISDEFIPEIVRLDELDEVIAVDDGDAIIMAQKLSHELGLAVGISSGANFLGAIKAMEMIGADKNVVTVLADDNKKYLSTDLLRDEPVKTGFISTDVRLLHFQAIRRVCKTCEEVAVAI